MWFEEEVEKTSKKKLAETLERISIPESLGGDLEPASVGFIFGVEAGFTA